MHALPKHSRQIVTTSITVGETRSHSALSSLTLLGARFAVTRLMGKNNKMCRTAS